MRAFVDDDGGKLAHPGLTSNEIFDLVQLAAAAYDDSFNASTYDLADGWFPITASLVGFGLDSERLKNGYFYEANSFPTGFLDIIYPGTAQAAVFSNGSGDIALAFRGTAEFGFPFAAGDSGDWGPLGQLTHFAAYQNLFDSLDAYIAAQDSVNRVLVTGHSLGGAMVERYMDAYPDNILPGISYEAVAVASPEASFRNDSRVLNIGHDGDIVYSIVGFKGANAVDNIYMLFNDGGFFDLGLSESFGAQHDIATGYAHTVSTILSSRFYGETTRDSQIVINYSDQPEDIRELVDDFFTPDDSQLILGRGADPSTDTLTNIKSGGTLSIDDWLIGGNGDDWLEGFRGDDILEGDVNAAWPFGGGNDTMAGGPGLDVAVFHGDCLEYDIVRNGNGSVTINHARNTLFGPNDGRDILFDVERARFSDGKELDLTLSEIHGCTELGFLRDFVTGTTQDTRVVFDMSRRGDTSYPIQVFVDGRVTTGNAVFNDFFYTLPAGENPQLIIGASVAEVFGDVAFDFEINVSVVSPLRQLVEFSDATAGGVLIGDRVDRRGGRWWGDPHLITFDNVTFDFQAEGEFVLARATAGNPYELQARFKALSSAVSVAEAVATRIGSDVVSIEIDGNVGELRINGVETQLSNGTQINVGNGTVSRSGRTLLIDHGNGDQTEVSVFATFLNASPKPALTRSPGSFEGLLGNNNGTPADDFRLANGTVLLTPIPIDTLYGSFAESWTVDASSRILPGVVTAFDAPDRIITANSLPATLRAQAEAVVAGYGITNELIREAAILDFALTGNVDFIEAAALTDVEFDPIVGTVAVDPVVNSVVVVTADLTTLVEEDPQARKATFTVSRGSTQGDLLVNYALTGFGVAPATAQDFVGGLTTGSVVIADGKDAATFQVDIVDDNIAEGLEAFDVAITLDPVQANNYEVLVSSLRLAIQDADEAANPTYTLKSSATELFEGERLSVSIATTDVPSGTPLYWSLSGSGITSSDFSDGMTTGTGAVGADGRYAFSTVIAVDSVSDPNESLQVKFFSDAGRTTQIGDTLAVLVKELPVGNPTDSSDIIQGTANDASAREIVSGIPVSSSLRGKQTVDFLTGLEGPDTFVLGDAVGTFYDDGIAAQKGSGDLGVILDFSSGDLIQLHGSPADYKLSKGAYTGGGFTNMRGLYISQVTPGSLDEVVGFIKGASLDTLSLTSNDQFIYAL